MFEKIISSTHLKYSHDITSNDYKKQFGENSLASEDYRTARQLALSGENNPMFGKKHTESAKQAASMLKKGKTAHNKGKKVTDQTSLDNIRSAICKREENYKINGNHPMKNKKLTEETREKISKSISEYTANNKELLKTRAKKMLNTKKENGVYTKQREETIARHSKKWFDHEYKLVDEQNDEIKIQHIPCGNIFERQMSSQFNARACTFCYPQQSVSDAEIELRNWLQNSFDLEYVWQDKQLLNGFEIDILIPSKKIAIEYNGLFWHSESSGKSKWYHLTKMQKCAAAGIRLIQIFEDEWQNKKELVKSRLKHILGEDLQKAIYARQCEIKQISFTESKKFAIAHHIQGAGTGHICYGLFYKNELTSVMDFAKLNKAKGQKHKDGSYELSRFCSNTRVIGAAGKLFARFVKEHNPLYVVSYSDKRWNTGNLYQQINFEKVGSTLPNYWYTKGFNRYYRFKFRKDVLVKEGFDPSLTEQQIMTNRNYHIIWDCGSDKWEWHKKSGE
jgi:hypothetical protein